MITMNIPNRHRVTVESGPDRTGPGYVVLAIAWSRDETAQVDRRWVRYDTAEEADAEAAKLADASWSQIGRWYAKA